MSCQFFQETRKGTLQRKYLFAGIFYNFPLAQYENKYGNKKGKEAESKLTKQAAVGRHVFMLEYSRRSNISTKATSSKAYRHIKLQ